MPKSENQKQKLLYLLKFFYEETDEEHTLTVNQMIDKLEQNGISAARRSIYDDIRTLQDFGIDIVMRKSKTCEYFLSSRIFETPELKILIDSIQSSRFITKKKSESIIKRLKQLASKPQSRKFSGQIYIYDRIKSMNECILYNVDTLHNAIAENRKVTFRYFDYNIKREKVFRKNGELYSANPLALTFDNENYYLIVYNEKYEDYVHYRVDKMTNIEISTEKRIVPDEKFNAAEYVKPMFFMFDGEVERITALFHISYLNVIIDRFGDNVILRETEDEECFQVTFKAAVSPTFLSWIIGFGAGALILSPQWVADEVKNLALEAAEMYEDNI
ncbi:WYL domain-containing protein [Ruminococcus sp.]|uniref:helix-turn-helix transcriptional regulator n=1 Tax=Ruminococcus sp. TaxID=41978 RepID=UPI0025F70D26|nr:WYL domain-containing protein [Ruminococcus sp.]